jgi:serine/threonine protein kinase
MIMNERKILSLLHHPFLINMKASFQDDLHLYLVMDYLRGGDLRYHICYKENFT